MCIYISNNNVTYISIYRISCVTYPFSVSESIITLQVSQPLAHGT